MNTKQKIVLSVLVTCVVLLIFLGIYLAYSRLKPTQTGNEQAFNPGGDFTLTQADGKIFRLRDHRDQIVLLFFGYTSCDDVCPLTLAKLAGARKLLGPDGNRVLIVFVTVDPDRDTPARLKEYMGLFGANSIGLTGTKEQIDKVVHAYHASYQRVPTKSAMGYIINHTNIVYLIDRRGEVRYLIHQEDSPKKITDVIKKYL